MRPIKFRGQTLNGEWVYGNLTILKNRIDHIQPGFYISNDFGMPLAYPIRPETLGQFTGFIDINKREIYEGDIVRANIYDDDTISLPVYYSDTAFWIDYADSEQDRFVLGTFPGALEVIGSIYEHPELLK